MKKGLLKRIAENERYSAFAMHFSVICGAITIIGLIVAIYSYQKTIKPALEFDDLEKKVSILENEKNELTGKNITLSYEYKKIQKDYSELSSKREQITLELSEKELKLSELKEEALDAQADAYMSPIIYEGMNYIYDIEKSARVKEFALEKLNELTSEENTDNQKEVLNYLTQFINDEITTTSTYTDLFNYRVYFFNKKLKDLGIEQDN